MEISTLTSSRKNILKRENPHAVDTTRLTIVILQLDGNGIKVSNRTKIKTLSYHNDLFFWITHIRSNINNRMYHI